MEAWLHGAKDWAPIVVLLSAALGWFTREQTKKIRQIVMDLVAEHNKNGMSHTALTATLRAERGALFQQVTQDLNSQDKALARIEERLDMLIDDHRRITRTVPSDPDYQGPLRRKTDNGCNGI